MSGTDTSTSVPEPTLREVMLRAGRFLLDRDELGLSLESINYTRVFEHLEAEYSVRVTRGSVHERIWASQDHFRQDLLTEIVAYLPKPTMGPALEAVGLGRSADEFAQRLCAVVFAGCLTTPGYAQLMAARALAVRIGDRGTSEPVHRAFAQRFEANLAEARHQFPAFLAALGLTRSPRVGLDRDDSCDLLRTQSVHLLEGGHLHHRAGSIDLTRTVTYRPGDQPATGSWQVFSVGIRSLIDLLYDPSDRAAAAEPLVPPPQPDAPVVDPDAGLASPSARRRREDLRRLVLTAGVEVLLRDGLHLRPEVLGYKRVFEHLAETEGRTVHRAQVHPQIWASNEAFHLDVLRSALADSAHALGPTETVPGAPTGRPTSPRQAAYDAIRLLAADQVRLGSTSAHVRRLQLIKSTFLPEVDPEAHAPLRAALCDVIGEHRERLERYLRVNVLDLGCEFRSSRGLTEDQALEVISELAATSLTGARFNRLAGIELATRPYHLPRADPSTGTDPWTPAGVAILAYVRHFYRLPAPGRHGSSP